TMGEAPESIVLVESVGDVDALSFAPGANLAYVTQTTLSVDETGEIIAALRRRFPDIHAPKKEDICYATSNRQWAGKEMLTEIEPYRLVDEDVEFRLPTELRRELALAAEQL